MTKTHFEIYTAVYLYVPRFFFFFFCGTNTIEKQSHVNLCYSYATFSYGHPIDALGFHWYLANVSMPMFSNQI